MQQDSSRTHRRSEVVDIVGGLPPCRWSTRTALDPKHRPQSIDRPSTTVRREWARFPQEAHLLDLPNRRIRRLTSVEIAGLQGFDPEWFDVPALQAADIIRAAGDAVPPPVAIALFRAIDAIAPPARRSFLEICAGSGGLASGAATCGFQPVALVESWPEACRILQCRKPWPKDSVHNCDVRDYDFAQYRNAIGVLCGGPPCQPWSAAGMGLGYQDPRDLLGMVHRVIAAVRPEVFVLENVPALLADKFYPYLQTLLRRLRRPEPGLQYGVLIAKINAGYFGVPQRRERLFLIGLRDRFARDCEAVFDYFYSSATHKNRPWATVGDVVSCLPDPGGWMAWHYATPPAGRRP